MEEAWVGECCTQYSFPSSSSSWFIVGLIRGLDEGETIANEATLAADAAFDLEGAVAKEEASDETPTSLLPTVLGPEATVVAVVAVELPATKYADDTILPVMVGVEPVYLIVLEDMRVCNDSKRIIRARILEKRERVLL